jgi:2-polyprenyl-6-hydroxyphenyl methylase/3-demethylubiquinone-9 3-methyltransferase
LGLERLDGRSFVDAGSGSGLFSLAARNLGAAVTSFDFDPQSGAMTGGCDPRRDGYVATA